MAEWRGRPLIAWAAESLRPHTDEMVVCGREWGGLRSVADTPRPRLGPLGGLAGALADAEAHGFEAVLTVPCDMPAVPGDLFERLTRRAPSFCIDAPVLGFWPAPLASALRERLEGDGDRSLIAWARAAGALPVAAAGPLANVNTPADLETA